jgi:DNA-binding NarL/FixJ family response regulator
MDKGPTTSVVPAGHRPRLLIADDDPVVRMVLGGSLERDFDVVGMAADSEEAIEIARASQPDAALLDVKMPKGGGLLAVRGIHHVAPATAIVMLSGYKSHGLVRELLQAGAMSYRRKGVATHVLTEALNESMKAHAAEGLESAWFDQYCLGLDRQPR